MAVYEHFEKRAHYIVRAVVNLVINQQASSFKLLGCIINDFCRPEREIISKLKQA